MNVLLRSWLFQGNKPYKRNRKMRGILRFFYLYLIVRKLLIMSVMVAWKLFILVIQIQSFPM